MQGGCTGHRGSSPSQENCLKGRHKIQDRWESDEYQVIGQPNPGIPVYEVKYVAGGRTRVLHCNLLLPLQGRLWQQGGQEEEDPQGPKEEEEEDSGLPGVPKAPPGETWEEACLSPGKAHSAHGGL